MLNCAELTANSTQLRSTVLTKREKPVTEVATVRALPFGKGP
jgi:hypothetical protein